MNVQRSKVQSESNSMTIRRRFSRPLFKCLALLVVAALVACCGQCSAQEAAKTRLFEREPYDLLKLKDTEKPLRIKPLPPVERRGSDATKRTGMLTIRLMDAPDTPYEVAWASIEKIDFFERMVLAEAEPLVESDKFDEAYDYFKYLQEEHPQTPGLAQLQDRYLWREATMWRKSGDNEQCFALLVELLARNPNYDRLEAALTETTLSLLDAAMEKEDYAVARAHARALRERFPSSSTSTVAEERLKQLAAAAVSAARDHVAGNHMADAYQQAERALRIWPDEARAKALLIELSKLYPRVVVGVTSPALEHVAGGFADRGAWRRAQLTGMRLVELRGYGPDGTEYDSPVAQIEQTDLGRKLVITLRPGTRWSIDGPELTGSEVARSLLGFARPESPGYRPELTELLAGVSVQEVYRVECELTRPFVKPLALLEVDLTPGYGEQGALGAYLPAAAQESERRFELNPSSSAAVGMPREIVEREYPDSQQALAALRNGQVTVLDRVNPWDLATLRAEQSFRVEPYATPTLHVLVPNRNRPLMSNRNFRRALVYGIDRQAMLEKLIWRGPVPPGSRVISGPFPAGAATDDPRGYAYNNQVAVRPYDPRLALTLIGVARLAIAPPDMGTIEMEAAARKPVPLRMAIPASDVARLAAKSIARQWKALGIDLELVEYGSDATREVFQVCDLVYRELMVREPVVEARRLLGSDGALGSSNAYLDLALLRLLESDNSVASRNRLRELHRLAAEDATLLPLWQLVDHFAYHESLAGVGSQPVSLYQHVRSWRPSPRLPTGTP